MLGTRGVRLGVIKPGLYAMQVRALMEAARRAGGRRRAPGHRDHDPPHRQPRRSWRWPAAGWRRRWPRWWPRRQDAKGGRPKAASAKSAKGSGHLEVTIGTMIETPRAALRAGEIAEVADFFSFGTNDLTQMTFGFSRDDVEGRMMSAYLELGLLPATRSRRSTPTAWASWCASGVERGRATRPDSRSGCAASTAAIPSRSPSSTTPGSTT